MKIVGDKVPQQFIIRDELKSGINNLDESIKALENILSDKENDCFISSFENGKTSLDDALNSLKEQREYMNNFYESILDTIRKYDEIQDEIIKEVKKFI